MALGALALSGCDQLPYRYEVAANRFVFLAIAAAAMVGIALQLRARFRFRPAPPLPPPEQVEVLPAERATTALKSVDPDFTPEGFVAHVRQVAQVLGTGGEDRDLWLSDGLAWRLRGVERKGEPAQVVLVGFDVDDDHQALRVRLEWSTPQPGASEVWTFLRRPSARTRAGPRAVGCPSCGAPMLLNASRRCAHCDAVVNSGEHGWVLTGITAGSAALHARADLVDLSGLRAVDPRLSAPALEDRAALVFLRCLEAAGAGASSAPASVAVPPATGWLADLPRASPAAALAARFELRALHSVGGLDCADVELGVWSEAERTEDRRVLRLTRRHGVTSAAQGLATARCDGCLGPLAEAEAGACQWCGRAFDQAWRAAELLPFSTWAAWFSEARAELAQRPPTATLDALPAHERRQLLLAVVAIARADGAVSNAEREQVLALATRLRLTREDAEAALGGAGGLPDLQRLRFGREAARELLRAMVEMAVADGRAEVKERALLRRVAGQLGAQRDLEGLLSSRLTKLLSEIWRHRAEGGGG